MVVGGTGKVGVVGVSKCCGVDADADVRIGVVIPNISAFACVCSERSTCRLGAGCCSIPHSLSETLRPSKSDRPASLGTSPQVISPGFGSDFAFADGLCFFGFMVRCMFFQFPGSNIDPCFDCVGPVSVDLSSSSCSRRKS